MDKANPFAKPPISTVSHVTLHGKTPNGATLSHALALESKRLTFESAKDKIWAALDAPTPPWIKKLQARVHRQRAALADLIEDRDSLRTALNGMVRLANRVTTAAEQWQGRAEVAEGALLVAESEVAEVEVAGMEPGPIVRIPRGEHIPFPGPGEPPTIVETEDLEPLLAEPVALIRVWLENGGSMDLGSNEGEVFLLEDLLDAFLDIDGQSRQDFEAARAACCRRPAEEDLQIAAQEIQIANQRDTIERLQGALADARRAEDAARRGHEECDYGNKCRRCGTVNLRHEERSCSQVLAEQKQTLESRIDYLESRRVDNDTPLILERDTARKQAIESVELLRIQQEEIKRLEKVILDAAITGPVPGGQPAGPGARNSDVLYPGDVIETLEKFVFYMTLGTAKEVLEAVREAGQHSPGKTQVRFRRAARLHPNGTAILEVERVHP